MNNIVHPFNMLICGHEGCGKSNFLLNLLLVFTLSDNKIVGAEFCALTPTCPFRNKVDANPAPTLDFDKIYLCNEDYDLRDYDPLYIYLKQKLGDVLTLSRDLNDLPDLDKLNAKTLVIIDNFSELPDRKNFDIINYFTQSAPNCSRIYIDKSYSFIPRAIRHSFDYYVLFPPLWCREREALSEVKLVKKDRGDGRYYLTNIYNV